MPLYFMSGESWTLSETFIALVYIYCGCKGDPLLETARLPQGKVSEVGKSEQQALESCGVYVKARSTQYLGI